MLYYWHDSSMKKSILLATILCGMMSLTHADEKQDAKVFLADAQKAISDGEKLLASRPTMQMIGAHSNLMRGLIERGRSFQQ